MFAPGLSWRWVRSAALETSSSVRFRGARGGGAQLRPTSGWLHKARGRAVVHAQQAVEASPHCREAEQLENETIHEGTNLQDRLHAAIMPGARNCRRKAALR